MSNKTKVNRIIIKRDWRGKIVELQLDTPETKPQRKPVLELLGLADSIFANSKEE